PAKPWRMISVPYSKSWVVRRSLPSGKAEAETRGRTMTPRVSVLVFEFARQFFDVFRRPARHFHAEVETHRSQHFLDFVQRLAAEVRRAEHFRLRLLDQVADVDDVVVLQAVRRTDRQFEFVDLLQERRVERQIGLLLFRLLLARLFEVDEDRELVLKNARRV